MPWAGPAVPLRPGAPDERPLVLLYNPQSVFHTMPLGLVAVGSALDPTAFRVRIVDARLTGDPHRALRAVLEDETPLCLGMGVLTGAPLADALTASRLAKAIRPGLPVIWGGWHPSLFPTECLAEPSIDLAVQGQGEATLAELARRLVDGVPLLGCPGTAARDAQGRPHLAPPRAWMGQEAFPRADYSLLDVEAYFRLKGRRQLDYVSSQGCFWRCDFCADPQVYGRKWSGQAPRALADRLLELHRVHAFDDVNFQDETFFTRPGDVLAMAGSLEAAGRPFTWAATMRADQGERLADAQFGALARGGLRRVLVGVESGTQAMLDWMHKDIRLHQVWVTAEKCRRHGIAGQFPFIVGFPGESEASVQQSLRMARRLREMSPQFQTPIFFFKPYPGTAITRDMVRAGHRLPQSLEEWARFDIYGAGAWVSPRVRQRVERYRFYERVAWDRPPGAWKRPLQHLARWRCRRERLGWPVEQWLGTRLRPGPKLT